MEKRGRSRRRAIPFWRNLTLVAAFFTALSFLSACDPNFLSTLRGYYRVFPLGTNEIEYFTYTDFYGTAELGWKGTISAFLVDEEDIPWEEVSYWYTDEEGAVRSRTQTLLKNAMGNHAGGHSPIYDAPQWIDRVELDVDRGEGMEDVDIYVFPQTFYILSWAFEGNSEENPLLFDPMTIHEPGWYRRHDFLMNREGWTLTFWLERHD